MSNTAMPKTVKPETPAAEPMAALERTAEALNETVETGSQKLRNGLTAAGKSVKSTIRRTNKTVETTSSRLQDKVTAGAKRTQAVVNGAIESVGTQLTSAQEGLATARSEVQRFSEEHPGRLFLVGLGLGVCAGALLRRPKKATVTAKFPEVDWDSLAPTKEEKSA